MYFHFAENHKEYLNHEYQTRRSRRPNYSLRAFARDLEISPATLTEYFNGNLKISESRIKLLSDRIGLKSEQCEHWIDLVALDFCKSKIRKEKLMSRIQERRRSEKNILTDEEFKLISEWHFLAILELLQINKEEYSKIKVLSEALRMTTSEVNHSLKLLLNHGLIQQNPEDIFTVSDNTFVFTKSNSETIRHFHSQVLARAQTALHQQTVKERFNSSTFIAVPDDKIQSIISELNNTAVKLLEPYIQNGNYPDNTKLYCLSFQFFNLLEKSK